MIYLVLSKYLIHSKFQQAGSVLKGSNNILVDAEQSTWKFVTKKMDANPECTYIKCISLITCWIFLQTGKASGDWSSLAIDTISGNVRGPSWCARLGDETTDGTGQGSEAAAATSLHHQFISCYVGLNDVQLFALKQSDNVLPHNTPRACHSMLSVFHEVPSVEKVHGRHCAGVTGPELKRGNGGVAVESSVDKNVWQR